MGQFTGENETEQLRRRCDAFFTVIERIEKERDALWEMYRIDTSEHLNAQAMMERAVMNLRSQLGRAVGMLNRMRQAQNLQPIKSPTDLEPYEGQPVGKAEAYADKMMALCSDFPKLVERMKPKMTDGIAERAAAVDATETSVQG